MRRLKDILAILHFPLAVSIFILACNIANAQAKDLKPRKILSGEELYAINCSRCHTERYPTERTEAQWKTIMMHMRVRANLPPDQAKKILEYLKNNN